MAAVSKKCHRTSDWIEKWGGILWRLVVSRLPLPSSPRSFQPEAGPPPLLKDLDRTLCLDFGSRPNPLRRPCLSDALVRTVGHVLQLGELCFASARKRPMGRTDVVVFEFCCGCPAARLLSSFLPAARARFDGRFVVACFLVVHQQHAVNAGCSFASFLSLLAYLSVQCQQTQKTQPSPRRFLRLVQIQIHYTVTHIVARRLNPPFPFLHPHPIGVRPRCRPVRASVRQKGRTHRPLPPRPTPHVWDSGILTEQVKSPLYIIFYIQSSQPLCLLPSRSSSSSLNPPPCSRKKKHILFHAAAAAAGSARFNNFKKDSN